MSIDEFLEARIAEDEAVAVSFEAAWVEAEMPRASMRDDHGTYPSTEYTEIGLGLGRWMAETAAKRRIVEIHYPYDHKGEHGSAVFCAECQWEHGDNSPRIDNQSVEGFGTHPCGTLAALASIYADHPDYEPAWRIA